MWGHGGLALPADTSHGKGKKSSETTLLSLDPLVILRESSRRSQVMSVIRYFPPVPDLTRVWWCLQDQSKAEMDLMEASESVQQQSAPFLLLSPKGQIHSRFQPNLDKI